MSARVLAHPNRPNRPKQRRRYRRLDEYPPTALSPADQAEIDRLLLEDKVATLIDRVPQRLLWAMLTFMDDDDLVLLDLLAQGIRFTHDHEDDDAKTRLRRTLRRRGAKGSNNVPSR